MVQSNNGDVKIRMTCAKCGRQHVVVAEVTNQSTSHTIYIVQGDELFHKFYLLVGEKVLAMAYR